MNYWLDLFTGTTWDEFRNYGANVTGFRPRMKGALQRVKPGDVFLCYLTKVMHWVGALEIIGESKDKTQIWKNDEYPVRFDVKPIIMLDAEIGIPMSQLEGKAAFYASTKDAGKFKGFVRMSPNLFKKSSDGEYILKLLKEAKHNPIKKEVDDSKLYPKKLYKARRKKGKSTVATIVSVPEPEDIIIKIVTAKDINAEATEHTKIQYNLLRLGADMGFKLWVARNDKGKRYDDIAFGDMDEIVDELPTQFNEVTNKTIELIDVLWLKGNSIVAAFEIEHTTSVYSGLLRMSDLLALQPNLNIKLYLVAPDNRRLKVEQEILRPTFTLQERPINEDCGFLPYSLLLEKIEGIRKLGVESSLKPEFLSQIAEYFTDDDF
ncbi:MAG: hypothetical protein KAJ07_02385 [Planctomycetes bacterium]|nr:hypothetical protein [Planctomycetota bacterium]